MGNGMDHDEIRLLHVVRNDTSASWWLQVPPRWEGTNFTSVSFDGDKLFLGTEDGSEIEVVDRIFSDEDARLAYAELMECDLQEITELDSQGWVQRSYIVKEPVVEPTSAYGV